MIFENLLQSYEKTREEQNLFCFSECK